MAGGTFDKSVGKTRPGTYINFTPSAQNVIGTSDRGTVVIPLVGHNYGPSKEFITLSNASPDSEAAKLGYSIYDDNPSMLLLYTFRVREQKQREQAEGLQLRQSMEEQEEMP